LFLGLWWYLPQGPRASREEISKNRNHLEKKTKEESITEGKEEGKNLNSKKAVLKNIIPERRNNEKLQSSREKALR